MHLIFEKPVEDHAPELYHADEIARGVDGLDEVGGSWLERYRTEGYLLVRHAFSRDEVDTALAELEDMTASLDPECASVCYEGVFRDTIESSLTGALEEGGPEAIRAALAVVPASERATHIRSFMGFTRVHRPLAHIADNPALRAALQRILGSKPRLFQSMALVKPPGGREKPWHQDHAYFNYPLGAGICGVWIALQRATPENGCMFALPRGHHEGPRIHFKRRDWQICDTDILGLDQVAFPMEPGDLMIFDGKLPHGTPTNHSPDQRWALQYHYIESGIDKTDEELRLAVFGSEGKGVYC